MQFYSLNLSKFRTISRNQRKSAKSSSCHHFPQIVALPRFQDYVTLEDRKGGAKIKNEGGGAEIKMDIPFLSGDVTGLWF